MTELINEVQDLERGVRVVGTEPDPIEQGRSLVVVIGINEYVHQHPLKNAVPDAIGLQQTLIDKLGFSAPILPLLNEAATKSAINSLVDDRLYEVVEENDSLIIFFAGHGTTRVRKIGGKEIETGYLVPVDATQSWSEYVEIDPLLRSVGALPARHILVILDSCESGLALGKAMDSYRDTTRYTKDLSNRFSRKVLTSAQRDQLAKDGGGPIPGHSLFTGTLIDGFNWGRADLDGNGLITSSELGLFIQQQVGQASESKQTPDFGSFHLDDRGEMVISLRDQSFDKLKARAFSALQRGEISTFKKLTQQIVSLKPSGPEALYLEYRLKLFECDIKQASNAVQKLFDLRPSAGTIPLSWNDLETLGCYLNIPNWAYSFTVSETDFPVEITLLSGLDSDNLQIAQPQALVELEGFCFEDKSFFKFKIRNLADLPIYVYLIMVDSAGRIEATPIWRDEHVDWQGLEPEETGLSYLFRVTKDAEFSGINEFRFFSSPQRINQLLRAPASDARSGLQGLQNLQDINLNDLKKIRTKVFYYKEI